MYIADKNLIKAWVLTLPSSLSALWTPGFTHE